MLLVEIAVSNVRFHSSQEEINQSIVVNAFRNINHKTEAEDLVEEAQVEEVAEDLAVEEAQVEEVDLTGDHEKCTKLLVEIAVMNAKSHLNQNKTSRFIVVNVFKTIKEIKNNNTSCFIRS